MITLVTAYYENPGMLREQFRRLRELPKLVRDRIEYIVVDDGSPRNPAVAEDCGVALNVYRIIEDVPWNHNAARNIGVRHATHAWRLITDIDHVVPEATWIWLLGRVVALDCKVAYRFQRVNAPNDTPYHFHPDTWLLHNDLWQTFGGFDEAYRGYYGQNSIVIDYVKHAAKELVFLPVPVVRYGRDVIPDASTVDYPRKTEANKAGLKAVRRRKMAAGTYWVPDLFKAPYEKVHP